MKFQYFFKKFSIIIFFVSLILVPFLSCSDDNEIRDLTKPALQLPANNSVLVDSLTVNLNWENSLSTGLQGPLRYKVYFGNSDSAEKLIFSTTKSSLEITNLSYDTDYSWRVESLIDGKSKQSDEVFSFKIRKTTDIELEALGKIYDALDGANWTNSENWKTTELLSNWFGVTVNEAGHVIELILPNNNLNGTIPSEIGNLKNLKILDLKENNFNSTLPTTIGNLTKLENLFINSSKLNGEIPIEIGNLASLKILNLQKNELRGGFPLIMGDLKNLEILNFEDNDISSPIPREFANLTKLKEIRGARNKIRGEIPAEFAKIKSLKVFFLAENELSGEIPNFSETKLSIFYVRNNVGLTGSLENSGLCSGSDNSIDGTSIINSCL